MGHKLSEKGIDLTKDKVDAVVRAREPENATEVWSFLGLVNFCARFIPNVATVAEPLRRLTRNTDQHRFRFGQDEKAAFEALKHYLSRAETLGFYDPSQPTRVMPALMPAL